MCVIYSYKSRSNENESRFRYYNKMQLENS